MHAGDLPDPALADNETLEHRSPTRGPPPRHEPLYVAGESVLPAETDRVPLDHAGAPHATLPPPARAAGPARVLELEKSRPLVSRIGEYLLLFALAAWLLQLWNESAPIVPVADGWAWINQAEAFARGGLAALWQTHPLVHTQHIYAVPSLFALLAGPLFGYSFRVFALLCVAFVFANGLLFRAAARREGLGPFAAVAVLAVVASMRHYENLLVGFQLGLPACVFFGTLALIVADTRRDRKGMLLAWTLAFLSLGCSSAGLFAAIGVMFVRGLGLQRPRLLIWTAIGAVLSVVALHFVLMAVYDNSFIGHLVSVISWPATLRVVENTAKVVGGGLVGTATVLPVGLALLAGALAIVVTRMRRLRRIDAFSGIVFFSFCSCVAIAIARTPFEAQAPSSRHAIYAAPLVGVVAIGLLSWLKNTPSVRALGYSSVFVGLLWSSLESRQEADGHVVALRMIAFDSSFAIAMTAQGETITAHDIELVNPAPTEYVRAAIRFVAERRLCGGDWRDGHVERHEDLPVQVQGATNVRTEAGLLRFAGQGHVFNEYVCGPEFGRVVQVTAEAACMGGATVGVILRNPDGSVRANLCDPVHIGQQYSQVVVRAFAAPGERIQPYVFARDPDREVVVKSFRVVLIDSDALRERP